MQLFAYEVSDRTGNRMEGNIQAESSDAARLALSNAGYTVYTVSELQSRVAANPPVVMTAPVQAPARIAVTPNSSQPVAIRPLRPANVHSIPRTQAEAVARPLAPSTDDHGNVKSAWSNDGKISLMFTQLGSMLRAGVNLSTALTEMSTQTGADIDREALKEAAVAVEAGRSMCDALERYPYRFGPDIIGTLRAGELGGFMAQSCDQIADQRMASHRFRNLFRFHAIYALSLLALAPFIYGISSGAVESIRAQDQAGGDLPIVRTLVKFVAHELPTSGLKSLLIIAALVGTYLVWMRMKFRMQRHQLVLRIPLFKQRTQMESLTRFCWVLSEVSRVGIAPQQCFQSAAAAIVNLDLRERVMGYGTQVRENMPISQVLRSADILPRDYIDIISTGEMTGDVPGALARVTQACGEDFVRRDGQWRMIAMVLGMAVTGIITVILCGILYTHLYSGIMNAVLTD